MTLTILLDNEAILANTIDHSKAGVVRISLNCDRDWPMCHVGTELQRSRCWLLLYWMLIKHFGGRSVIVLTSCLAGRDKRENQTIIC